jgi:polyisoprenoid-binding protein YceI
MRRGNLLIALVVSAALALGTSAQAATWVIDNNHSTVGFKVRHIFTKVPGLFNKFSGTIDYDAAKPEAGSVKVEIDAASIDTRNDRRNNHLRSADFFDVEKYPTLAFQSTKVVKNGESDLSVEGNLTIHGVTKPVTLAVSILGASATTAGFEATTTINRKDFGILWNRTLDNGGLLLGEDVEIEITIEANVPDESKS